MGLFSQPIFGNGGLFGGNGPAGQEDPQADARLAMMAQLLQGGGYSPQRSSFGQIMGQALMAGHVARQQTIESQRKREADDVDKRYREAQIQNFDRDQNPASVKEYEYAKTNGYKGSFQEWTTAGGQTSRPSSVQEWEFFSKLDAGQQQRYLEMKRNPNWKVDTVNQVPTVIQGGVGGGVQTTPLSTTASEASAAGTVKGAEAQAGAAGTGLGNIEAGIQTRGANAQTVQSMLDIADPLIDVATGSTAGAAVDAVAKAFGGAPDGAKAIASLQVLQAGLMTNMPRMEGPQSDRDVDLYRQAAGQIGDPSVPREIKKAALATIRELQQKYRERASSAAPSGPSGPTAPKTETAAQRAKRMGL